MATSGDAFDYESDSEGALESLPAGADPPPLVVRLPRGCRVKQELLAEYVRQLRLPDYFGWNWDALEECLRDLSWLAPGRTVMIAHAGLPLRGRSRRVYLEVLDNVVRHWRESKQWKVRVKFPRSLEAKIKRILRPEVVSP
jgi:hypothetical protein